MTPEIETQLKAPLCFSYMQAFNPHGTEGARIADIAPPVPSQAEEVEEVPTEDAFAGTPEAAPAAAGAAASRSKAPTHATRIAALEAMVKSQACDIQTLQAVVASLYSEEAFG